MITRRIFTRCARGVAGAIQIIPLHRIGRGWALAGSRFARSRAVPASRRAHPRNKRTISPVAPDVTHQETSGLAGYEIFRSNSSGGPFTVIATTTATKYNNSGLSSNRAYWYYVKAYDKAGNRSTPSNTATATAGGRRARPGSVISGCNPLATFRLACDVGRIYPQGEGSHVRGIHRGQRH